MTNEHKAELEALCLRFRNDLVDILHSIQTGHPGGSLSCCEIVTALYQDIMNVDPKNPEMEGRDHFILSKGHAAPMLYLNLAEKGFFPKEELKTLRQLGSRLQGHPCVHKLPGVELSTGPLGLGLGAGLGMAIADKMKGYKNYTYVLLGDGEIQEGAIWEAAMAGAKYKPDNLIAILDYNGVQLDGTTEQIMPMGDIPAMTKRTALQPPAFCPAPSIGILPPTPRRVCSAMYSSRFTVFTSSFLRLFSPVSGSDT